MFAEPQLWKPDPSTGSVNPASLPPAAWLTALASMPGAGPRRLSQLLGQWPDPAVAWRAVLEGAPADIHAVLGKRQTSLVEGWKRFGASTDVADLWELSSECGIGAVGCTSPAFPAVLAGDPEPPAILFHLGDPDVIAGPRVGIIGTRKCTRYGHDIAKAFGRDLSIAGVAVVSGLALGVDAAAHQGAADAAGAPPIAVVANGLDSVYPRRNRQLWADVAEAGVVLSEAPYGQSPERWRFPARNRIIAALSDIVVVVESHDRGGSMHTVAEAALRDVPVMAVPGPIHSPSAEGTNELLRDGCAPACSVDDVLVEVGMLAAGKETSAETRPDPTGPGDQLLDAMGWLPVTAEQLLGRLRWSVAEVGSCLACLQADGWIVETNGWFERIARG